MSELHDECGVIGVYSTDDTVDIVEDLSFALCPAAQRTGRRRDRRQQ